MTSTSTQHPRRSLAFVLCTSLICAICLTGIIVGAYLDHLIAQRLSVDRSVSAYTPATSGSLSQPDSRAQWILATTSSAQSAAPLLAAETVGVDQTLADIRILIIAGLSAMFIALCLAIPMLVRRALKPLVQPYHNVAASDVANDYGVDLCRMPVELMPLVALHDSLADRLRRTLAQEQWFSRNIANELRGPLAELRAIVQSRHALDDRPLLSNDFVKLSKIAAKMEKLLTCLMIIVRQQSGHLPIVWQRTDLGAEIARYTHDQRGIELHSPAGIWVRTDRICLEIIITYLIGAGITVRDRKPTIIDLVSNATNVSLVMTRPADGLHEVDVPRILNRCARENWQSTDQSGLRLSVAAVMVDSLGWNISATWSEINTLTVTISGIQRLSARTLGC